MHATVQLYHVPAGLPSRLWGRTQRVRLLEPALLGMLVNFATVTMTAMLTLAVCEQARASRTVASIAFGAFERPISGTQGIRRFA